ncbi:pyridoxamine 5'-phosphate oxidase family protein [Phenylobacterium sp.]|uniref:pyridoxamine 5'-phosphate oxidase family protein n=1 Tax=Phenylobacterium sp. TaxID=1871053 RepID=UPI00286DF74A|nr:pyridoxamine 5'-phosphate oxidase family protein [Phenylobacterium sp.]
MILPDAFHTGELEAQRRAGGGPRGHGIRDHMPDQHRQFFETLPYAVLAALDPLGQPVATLITGEPGFIAAPNPLTLSIATVLHPQDPVRAGLAPAAPFGLLGLDLATRRRNRANGRVAAATSANYWLVVDQSFGNCPQYIQRREPYDAVRTPGGLEVLTGLDADARTQVLAADTFFVATAALGPNGGVDVSHRGGRSGFVAIEGEALVIPDFPGNRYFNTLGNLLAYPRAGLLFVDFETGDLLHLQGSAEVLWDADADASGFAGSQRVWRLTVDGGWRRRAAAPLAWTYVEESPVSAATGRWPATARDGKLSLMP